MSGHESDGNDELEDENDPLHGQLVFLDHATDKSYDRTISTYLTPRRMKPWFETLADLDAGCEPAQALDRKGSGKLSFLRCYLVFLHDEATDHNPSACSNVCHGRWHIQGWWCRFCRSPIGLVDLAKSPTAPARKHFLHGFCDRLQGRELSVFVAAVEAADGGNSRRSATPASPIKTKRNFFGPEANAVKSPETVKKPRLGIGQLRSVTEDVLISKAESSTSPSLPSPIVRPAIATPPLSPHALGPCPRSMSIEQPREMRELEPALHVAESLPDTIKEEIIVVSNPWAGLLAELGAENMACLRAYVQKEQLGRFMEKLIKRFPEYLSKPLQQMSLEMALEEALE